nr:hypothetical protein [Burkholderia cepacia]
MRAKRGICNLERIDSRALVRDKAREFPFVLGQPLYVGSTQVNINPVAIRRSPLPPRPSRPLAPRSSFPGCSLRHRRLVLTRSTSHDRHPT